LLDSVIGDFFDLLWPTTVPDAGLSICTSSPKREPRDRFKFRRRLPPSDRDALIEECVSWANRGEDVYTGVGATRLGAHARGAAKDVVALPAMWAEIDINGPAHKKPTGVPSMTAALGFVHGLGLEPSFLVESGHGLHVYWLFEEPWLLPVEAEWQRADRLFRRFGETLRVKAERLGYKLDPVWELARVLRVPGTYNFKNGEQVPVILRAEDRPLTYRTEHFERWISADVHQAAEQVPSRSIEVVETVNFRKTQVGDSLADSAEWPARLAPLIKRLKELARGGGKCKPGTAVLARKMLAREPLADMGDRDNTTNAAAGVLAFAAKYMPVDIHDLMSVLWGSVENMPGGLDDPPPSKQNVLRKLKAAMEDAAREVAEEKAQNAAIEEGLVRQGRARRQQERAGISDLGEYRKARQQEEADDGAGYYTPADIQRFADDNGCTVAEWQHRWLIAVNNRYFIWTEDRYVAWPPMHAAVTIERELGPANLDLHKRNKKGEITGLISVEEMVRRFGMTARAVEIDLAAQKTSYDATRQTIVESPCPVRPLKPTFHPQVDAWLRALGGSKADKVLDWVATATELGTPSSAIYFDGQASAGKSMFALGMARLWGTTPAAFSQVFGSNFNSDLARCPLVFADEALPETRDKDITAVLRDAVSQEERTLNRKHQDEMTMHGAVRIVIAGNNPDLITKSAKGLSGADLHAYVARFLHIKVGPEAAELLKQWGGRATTHDWVSGNKIAEHALWLRANRKVAMGRRFRVDGEETSMHRAIAAKGASKVLEWTATFLGQKGRQQNQNVLIAGEGVLLVSAWGIHQNWSDVPNMNEAAPGLKTIGGALKAISHEEPFVVKHNNKETQYRVVDISHLTDLMRDVDGDLRGMEERLAQPLPEWLQEDLRGRVKLDRHPWLAEWRTRSSGV
jgi:hypothetical protein